MTLTEFLLARIAEDEQDVEDSKVDDTEWFMPAAWNRERWRAECEAKRRIVAMADGSSDFTDAMPIPGYAQPYHSPSIDVLIRTQMLLALPYADHPDYRKVWKP